MMAIGRFGCQVRRKRERRTYKDLRVNINVNIRINTNTKTTIAVANINTHINIIINSFLNLTMHMDIKSPGLWPTASQNSTYDVPVLWVSSFVFST